jgi:hypothetical protein
MPVLVAIPPGGRAWPNSSLDDKNKLLASSILNSIKSKLVNLKIADNTITIKNNTKFNIIYNLGKI